MLTQGTFGVLALLLGLLNVTHVVPVWMVFVVAALLGLTTAADNPTRRAFVMEMSAPSAYRTPSASTAC